MQPLVRLRRLREQPRRDSGARDAKVDVAHHPAERARVDEQAERGESVDEHLARVVVPHLGVERLRLRECR